MKTRRYRSKSRSPRVKSPSRTLRLFKKGFKLPSVSFESPKRGMNLYEALFGIKR